MLLVCDKYLLRDSLTVCHVGTGMEGEADGGQLTGQEPVRGRGVGTGRPAGGKHTHRAEAVHCLYGTRQDDSDVTANADTLACDRISLQPTATFSLNVEERFTK